MNEKYFYNPFPKGTYFRMIIFCKLLFFWWFEEFPNLISPFFHITRVYFSWPMQHLFFGYHESDLACCAWIHSIEFIYIFWVKNFDSFSMGPHFSGSNQNKNTLYLNFQRFWQFVILHAFMTSRSLASKVATGDYFFIPLSTIFSVKFY